MIMNAQTGGGSDRGAIVRFDGARDALTGAVGEAETTDW